MVRFIILISNTLLWACCLFTFHYGQIYYFRAFNTSKVSVNNLHSTMVRFIMEKYNFNLHWLITFTFHYGQIYYSRIQYLQSLRQQFTFHYGQIYYRACLQQRGAASIIYIPLWLDLLLALITTKERYIEDLHSTMVRFIIRLIHRSANIQRLFTFHYGQIYYPLQRFRMRPL